MPRPDSAPCLWLLLIAILGSIITDIKAAKEPRRNSEIRDTAIREELLSISRGKLPQNDDRLINLIADNLREVAIEANDPTIGLEAAARRAQEAVSEVTAAYTAVIFRASSITEAQRLFNRFEDTVNKIVDFSKSGSFLKYE